MVVHCLNRGGSRTSRNQPCFIAIFQATSEDELTLVSDSSRRGPEGSSGLTVSDCSGGVGVVPGLGRISMGPSSSPGTTGRPVHNGVQSQATLLCRCSVTGLEPVVRDIPIPSSHLPHQVLLRLRTYKGKVALIAPNWPQCNWYPFPPELNLRPKPIPTPA